MQNLGFMLAPPPCDIADAAEGICELPTTHTPAVLPPAPATGGRPAVQPPARPGALDNAKDWALAHSTELLIGAAAVCVLAIALGGRRR